MWWRDKAIDAKKSDACLLADGGWWMMDGNTEMPTNAYAAGREECAAEKRDEQMCQRTRGHTINRMRSKDHALAASLGRRGWCELRSVPFFPIYKSTTNYMSACEKQHLIPTRPFS